LGTPVALAMSLKSHDVMGFDVDGQRLQKEHFLFSSLVQILLSSCWVGLKRCVGLRASVAGGLWSRV